MTRLLLYARLTQVERRYLDNLKLRLPGVRSDRELVLALARHFAERVQSPLRLPPPRRKAQP